MMGLLWRERLEGGLIRRREMIPVYNKLIAMFLACK